MKIKIKANDYAYEGELSGVIIKSSGQVRIVVEDEHGRLFIHGPLQIDMDVDLKKFNSLEDMILREWIPYLYNNYH